MNQQYLNLIAKYAIILSVCYVLSHVVSSVMMALEWGETVTEKVSYRFYVPFGFEVLLNLATAMVVYRDINTYQVKTKSVLVATIIYRPIGAVAFLLFLLLGSKIEGNNHSLKAH